MIEVTIDGKRVVPLINSTTKVTLENPFLKDRDKWTMEFKFPLDIFENIQVFGHVKRLDVERTVQSYNDCIVRDTIGIIVRGVGIVTKVSETEVCLQIKSGMQKIAYRSDFEQVYIDQMEYNTGDIGAWVNRTDIPLLNRLSDGQGRWAFPVVYDEVGKVVLNTIKAEYIPVAWDGNRESYHQPNVKYTIRNAAVQPSLMFVLKEVLSNMGYALAGYDENFDYWEDMANATNNLCFMFICNNRQTTSLAQALPHWSVKKFIDEVKNLFNITFIFDETNSTVSVKKSSTVYEQELVSYECLDEFSTEYEEQGLATVNAANIQYNLSSSAYRKGDDIQDDVLDAFEVRQYSGLYELEQAANGMGDNAYRVIFTCPLGWYYVRNEDGQRKLKKALFQHIRRNKETETVSLNIAPVAMGDVEFEHYVVEYRKLAETTPQAEANLSQFLYNIGEVSLWTISMPCITSEARTGGGATVQQAVEENASVKQDEDERMEVMYLNNSHTATIEHTAQDIIRALEDNHSYAFNQRGWVCYLNIITYLCNTDKLQFFANTACLGNLHPQSASLEGRIPLSIKFFSDDIPDPTKVYVFRGKRFLCDKIEMEIIDGEIDKVKTGYFYEYIQ